MQRHREERDTASSQGMPGVTRRKEGLTQRHFRGREPGSTKTLILEFQLLDL